MNVGKNDDEDDKMAALAKRVDANGGVLTVYASELRDAYGADRLGSIVRENISKALSSRGLTHYPTEIPDRQNDQVRIYRIGSKVGEIVEAVLKVGENGDKALRGLAPSKADEVVKKIRELLDV